MMMDREVDSVAEIVRLFRLLDPYDKCLTKGLLDEMIAIEEFKVKKVSPLSPQDVADR